MKKTSNYKDTVILTKTEFSMNKVRSTGYRTNYFATFGNNNVGCFKFGVGIVAGSICEFFQPVVMCLGEIVLIAPGLPIGAHLSTLCTSLVLGCAEARL